MATIEEIAEELVDVIRRNLPKSAHFKVKESETLTREQSAAIRPAIQKLVTASIVKGPDDDTPYFVHAVTDAVVKAISANPRILIASGEVVLSPVGVQGSGMVGTVSASFSGGGTLSVVVDTRRPAQTGWLNSENLSNHVLWPVFVVLVSMPVQTAWDSLLSRLHEETVAIELLVSADVLNVRLGPSLDSQVLGQLLSGTRVFQIAEDGEWRQVVSDTVSGWVHEDFVREIR